MMSTVEDSTSVANCEVGGKGRLVKRIEAVLRPVAERRRALATRFMNRGRPAQTQRLGSDNSECSNARSANAAKATPGTRDSTQDRHDTVVGSAVDQQQH